MMCVKNKFSLTSLALCGLLVCSSCAAQAPNPAIHRWTQFVQVEGQPEPVPAEWVATPEGKFAHSIKIPNPVPKDSGYRKGMTSEQYFEHLCKSEAGEFIYKAVDNVEGFYFMRPPKRPTDDDLMDRYKLEAPEIERLFQLLRDTPAERATLFINPPWNKYRFIEEPNQKSRQVQSYVRIFGYKQNSSAMKTAIASELNSRYGLIWRGIKRPNDRELAIAGGEWIVIDLKSYEVLAIMRNYGLTGRARNTPDGIWWLNALACQGTKRIFSAAGNAEKLYEFSSKVISPVSGGDK